MLVAERLEARRRGRGGRGRGPGLPQHHRRGRRAGPRRGRDRRGRARRTAAPTGWPGSGSTSSSSRPTPPARSTWAAPAGRRSATRSAGSSRRAGPRSPASTTSTTTAPRSTGSAGRCWRARATSRLPRTATPASYIDEIAAAGVACDPDAADLPDAEAQEVFRDARRRDDVRGDQARPPRLRRRLRRLLPRAVPARRPARSSAPSTGSPRWATSTRRTARSGCAPSSTATTRTAWSSKSDGQPAYISGDLAYYLDKRERGFDRCVIMLGADHHGYVGRMMAMCAAFGDTPGENLEILIGQMVNLLEDGQPVRMSKRAGTVVTMNDLVDAVGVDAARYALARYIAGHQHRHRPRPVGRGQPTTTRSSTCSTPTPGSARSCATPADLGVDGRDRDASTRRCSTHEQRGRRCCGRWPSSRGWSRRRPSCASRTASRATSRRSPAAYHRFYDTCRVLPMGDEEPTDLHRARLRARRRDPRRARQRPRPARRLRARADVTAR